LKSVCWSIGKYVAVNKVTGSLEDVESILENLEKVAREIGNQVFGYKKILGGSSEFFESDKNKKSGVSPKEKNLTNNLYQKFLKNALCVFFETIVSNVKLFLTEKYSRLKFLMTKYPYLLRRLGTNMLQVDRDSFRITFLEFFLNGKLLQDLVLKKGEDLTTEMMMLAKSQQSSLTANKFLAQTSPAQEKIVWSVSIEG
jgi:hypothetical protein